MIWVGLVAVFFFVAGLAAGELWAMCRYVKALDELGDDAGGDIPETAEGKVRIAAAESYRG